MREIRIHGRGGQGSLVLAQLMAIAALEDNKYGQAFPFLGGGGERRGKAIMAFCRLSEKPIRLRSRVSQPHYVIVQDPTILNEQDVLQGLRPEGLLLINTRKEPHELGLPSWVRVQTFSRVQASLFASGKPLINTFLLGAFSAITGELTLQAVLRAVRKRFPGKLGEENTRMVEESFSEFGGKKP